MVSKSQRPLPCPFCGVLPYVQEGKDMGRVECINDRCDAQPYVTDRANLDDGRGSAKYRDEAIRRWNRREVKPDRTSP